MAKTVLVFAGLWLYLVVAHVELFSASFIQTDDLSRDARRREPPPSSVCAQPNISWDYLLLAAEWPQSFCEDVLDMRYTKSCVVPLNVTTWTVHGLWPSKFNGEDVYNCNTSYLFNKSQIEDLLPEMRRYWPILLKKATTKLWAHEWNKHGTCAGLLPELKGEHNYFKKALDLLHHFNYDSIFESQGLVPSNTKSYKLDDFSGAVQKAIGQLPVIDCYTTVHKEEQITYILQVKICLDKTFQPIKCPQESFGNCGKRNITYPIITHK